MKKPHVRVLGSIVFVAGVALSASARIAPIAVAGALLPACDPYECTSHNCDEYGSGSNGKAFSSCCACGSDYGASIELRDDTGKAFYHCDDSNGSSCATDPGYDSAIQTYCGL